MGTPRDKKLVKFDLLLKALHSDVLLRFVDFLDGSLEHDHVCLVEEVLIGQIGLVLGQWLEFAL